MDKFSELKAAAMAATPGRIGDRIDGSGSIKYECTGYDGSLVLRTDHKDMEYGFVGDNADADELFFRLCVPDVVLTLLAELEAKDKRITTVTEESEFWRERVDGAEKEREEFRRRFNLERSCLEDADKRIAELEAKLARFGDVRQHYLAGYDDGHSRGLNAGRLYKEDTGMVMHRHASANAYAAEGDE